MRHDYTPIRMARIKILTISNAGEGSEKEDPSHTAGDIKPHRPSREQCLINLNMQSPYDL